VRPPQGHGRGAGSDRRTAGVTWNAKVNASANEVSASRLAGRTEQHWNRATPERHRNRTRVPHQPGVELSHPCSLHPTPDIEHEHVGQSVVWKPLIPEREVRAIEEGRGQIAPKTLPKHPRNPEIQHAASVLPVNVHAIDPDLPPFQMSRSCSTFSALGSSHLSEALLARATRALGQRRRSLPRRALRSRRSRLGISRLEPRGVHVERGVRLVSYGRLRSLHGQRGRRCSLRGGRRRG